MASRELTAGERDIAGEVFGGSVDCGRVRVHDRRWLPLLQPRDSGMAPLGRLYMHGAFWREDYSACTLGLRAVFVHELTHVWQWQTGVCVPLMAGAWQMVRTGFRYGRAYAYEADPGKDLLDYNLEQQARIVEDWYAGRRGGAMTAVLRRFLEDPAYPRAGGPR